MSTWGALSLLLLAQVPPDLGEWRVLQEGDISVACTVVRGSSWCRARATIAAPPDRIESIIKNVPEWPRVFKRIVQSRLLSGDTFHIVLDLPSPVSNRDYVARFERFTEGADVGYRWSSVIHPDAPRSPDTVRLDHSAGEWRITPSPGGAIVTYTWNGELGGDFPAWALERAHLSQGVEVLSSQARSL